jgi:hypothetical protein
MENNSARQHHHYENNPEYHDVTLARSEGQAWPMSTSRLSVLASGLCSYYGIRECIRCHGGRAEDFVDTKFTLEVGCKAFTRCSHHHPNTRLGCAKFKGNFEVCGIISGGENGGIQGC